MKKVIYTISFIAIAVAFSGTSALAQSVTRINASIPFDFTIGGEVFEAGKYVMRVEKMPSGAEKLEMRDAKNRIVYQAFTLQNGDSTLGKPELIFDRVGGQAVLERIRLENKGIGVPVEKGSNVAVAARDRKRTSGSAN